MASDFRVSTATVLGYGFSQLFWGPQADRFGRRPIALTGVPGSGSFLVLRLIQGVAAGYDTSVSRACLRDLFSQRSLAQAMSLAAISYALALGIAPILGGWIASVASSWRANFALIALLGSLVLAYLARALGETLPPRVSRPITPTRELAVVVRDYARLLRDRRFLLPALIAMLATGVVAGYAAISPSPCRCRPSPPRRARPQPSPVSCSWKERPCSSARLSGCPTPPRCHWRSACSFLP